MLECVPLGSGLSVSRLCLGTMNFGEPGHGDQGDWALGADVARQIVRSAIDSGLFYFDCADLYGGGTCEVIVGRLLREMLPRDEYVLQTKVAMPLGPGANQGGLSRKHIIEGVDASLRRLGHDHVDVLVIHRHPHGVPGYAAPPIEETLEALHDVVRAGKALYLAASSMFAWQFAELQLTARMHGWPRFVAMQNHYNLLYREEEREMNPYCVNTGVALTPWSPLARGVLTGSYRGGGFEKGSSARSRGRDRSRSEGLYGGGPAFQIAERAGEVAHKHGVSRAQVAIAWLLGKPGMAAPVVGVSRVEQLEDLVAGTTLELSPEEITYLEELYQPRTNLLSTGTS